MRQVTVYTIYATPKGKPKAWRKRGEHWNQEAAQAAAWLLLEGGNAVRLVKSLEEVRHTYAD